MRYENKIRIHKNCVKFLKKLNHKTKKKVKDVISSLIGFPLISLDVVKLKGYTNVFRVRVGKIRILFEYDETKKLIFIRKIGFRKKIYEKV